MARATAQENLLCPSYPTRLAVLENRLKQTEEVLVMERLAQRRVLCTWWERSQPLLRNPLEQRVLSARRNLVNPRRRVEKVA